MASSSFSSSSSSLSSSLQDYEIAGRQILKRRNGRVTSAQQLIEQLAKQLHDNQLDRVDLPRVQQAMRSFEITVDSQEHGGAPLLQLTDIGSASIIGDREYQEDRMQVIQRDGLVAAAVYDGHCGDAVSQRLADPRTGLLVGLLQCDQCLPPLASQTETRRFFAQYDAALPSKDAHDSGSTAVAMIQRDDSIALYNVGDSRACIYDLESGEPLLATKDHSLEAKCEMRRVLAHGARLEWDDEDRLLRVDGHLAMSRAFGDHAMGVDVVTAQPDVYLFKCPTKRCASIGVVLASDGLWDEQSTEQVGQLLLQMTEASSQSIANRLVQVAKQHSDQSDNTTAIVVRFISRAPSLEK